MTAELIGHYPQGSPEWHKARLDGLGGSEIAAVLGLSKWESHFALWHRKQGRIPAQPQNPGMEWGHRLEPAILAKFTDDHPELAVDTKPGTWRNVDRPWQLANPDALAIGWDDDASRDLECVVEVKNVNDRAAWEWDDGPPPYYLLQARWYLDVFGLDRAIIAALFGGSDYAEFEVRPDPDDTALMRSAGFDFMVSLTAGLRPDIDSHDATYTAIRQLPDGVIDDKVEIDPELAARYEQALVHAKIAAEEKTLASSLVLDAIGNHKGATVNGRTIATRTLRKGTNQTASLRPARNL